MDPLHTLDTSLHGESSWTRVRGYAIPTPLQQHDSHPPFLTVTYSPGLASWTLLENVNGCPCCMSPMHLSLCAQVHRPWWREGV